MTDKKNISTCPICGTTWEVTIFRDCLLPACGCYGDDTSADNPKRPCERCGIDHALSCEVLKKMYEDEVLPTDD